MKKTVTVTLEQEHVCKILDVLENSRPELPEDAQVINQVINILKMAPCNEGR